VVALGQAGRLVCSHWCRSVASHQGGQGATVGRGSDPPDSHPDQCPQVAERRLGYMNAATYVIPYGVAPDFVSARCGIVPNHTGRRTRT